VIRPVIWCGSPVSLSVGNVSDIILDALPLSFDYGLYQVLMAFLFGGTVVLEKSFAYPYKAMERLVQEKVTGFPLVPTMTAILLQMDNFPKFDLSSLRYIPNGAAFLWPISKQALLPREIFSMRVTNAMGLLPPA
jgi:acyl-CoA synthetase (AMP-forming)/AMP-acid ligase II